MKKTVSYVHINEVVKILDRLVKKAEKHGVEFNYKVSDTTYYRTVSVFDTDGHTINDYSSCTYKVEVIDIDITDTIICANGWTLAAHIEHMDAGHNVVTPLGYAGTIPAEWYTISGNCEHCNSSRYRTKTYMVERNGEYRQVGKSCLREYTGIFPDLAVTWAQVDEMVINDITSNESLYSMFGSSIPSVYSVVDVIALAIDSILEFGYMKSDSFNSTKEKVSKMLTENKEPTLESKKQAQDICEFITTYERGFGGMDIIFNAKAVVLSEYCKYKHFGRLVYLPVAVKREQERQAQAKARAIESAKSNYIGQIGQRITVELKSSKYVSSFETQYGVTSIYRFTDANDNVMMWFSSRAIDIDKAKTITGTIKKHDDYNGEKQTILTRCKVS